MTLDPALLPVIGVVAGIVVAAAWLIVRTGSRAERHDRLDPPPRILSTAHHDPDTEPLAAGLRAAAGPVITLDDLIHVIGLPQTHDTPGATATRRPRLAVTRSQTTVGTFAVAIDIAHRRSIHTGLRHCVHREPEGYWFVHLAHPPARRHPR